ncbi:MAG: CotH kinase family protein [Lachnospiraceae bacterium]|nr:CotH kinase family protein [Lachnospiraceae bacterium]
MTRNRNLLKSLDNNAIIFLLIGIPLLGILIAAAWGLSRKAPQQEQEIEKIEISLDSGFYQEDRILSVKAPIGTTVYYSDNGSEPDRDTGKLYEEPIMVEAGEEIAVKTFRFKAYDEEGHESATINRTFFTGSNVDIRYHNNVLHIAGDEEELFGYEEGIFVPGRTYDEYKEANPDVYNVNGVEANFTNRGQEYEREVYMEYFTADGDSILSQECGVRIYGAMTRMKNQKSFRLYARSEYDVQNEFQYPVLTQLVSATDGTVAQEHKRLILRNSGNDNGFGFIRSELTGRLAGEAGFPDVMQAEPVCVYINGRYYGIYWLENGFDDQYFINRYGEHTGEFVVLEGGDDKKLSEEDSHIQSYVEEYNELYDRFAELDLTDEQNYKALEKVLDIENYLQYFAIENYVGNVDWPGNNVRVYRYVSPDGEYQEGTVFDGRYRHMLFDVDYAFGLMLYNDSIGTGSEDFTLSRILSGEAPLFAALMEREDCQAYFTGYTLDLINHAMSYEHVEETLAEMHLSRYDELYYMLEETDLMKDSLWDWETDASIYYDNVELNYQRILEYAELHPGTAMTDMTLSFGYDFANWYMLYVTKSGMSDLNINSIFLEEESFEGIYFGDVPVVLTPVMAKNEVFDHWLVNGEIRKEDELTLTASDIVEGSISVEMVVHDSEEPILELNRICSKGQNDYIELINRSDKPIETRGYYLSDSEDAYRYPLPAAVIEPGDTIKYYGRDNMDEEVLGRNGMNFNLKEGETVTFTYREKQLEKVTIPDLLSNGIYQRYGDTGKFIEILTEGE